MTTQARTTLIYAVAVAALVLLFRPYIQIVDMKKSIILHLMMRFPLFLLGDWNLHLNSVSLDPAEDFIAIAFNPGFVSGAIVGRFLVKDWPSTFKALIPAAVGSVCVFLFGLGISAAGGGRGGDMAGLWIMAPIATLIFWPFAWLGAVAAWKGSEYYERQKSEP